MRMRLERERTRLHRMPQRAFYYEFYCWSTHFSTGAPARATRVRPAALGAAAPVARSAAVGTARPLPHTAPVKKKNSL
jgi:hypothetical protein